MPRNDHLTNNDYGQFVRRLADQFNADERVWASLAPLRKLRRKLKPRMSARQRKALASLDFARAQRPQDCVGYWRVG